MSLTFILHHAQTGRAFRNLTNASDSILMEKYTYSGIIEGRRALSPNRISVNMDSGGSYLGLLLLSILELVQWPNEEMPRFKRGTVHPRIHNYLLNQDIFWRAKPRQV